jgi:hypothetical protein
MTVIMAVLTAVSSNPLGGTDGGWGPEGPTEGGIPESALQGEISGDDAQNSPGATGIVIANTANASVLSGQWEVDGGPIDPNGNGSYDGEINCDYGGPGCEVWNQFGGPGAQGQWEQIPSSLPTPASLPWTFGVIFSTPNEPIGPAFNLAYNPKTTMLFVGGGLGISEGHNLSFGPLSPTPGEHPNIDNVLSGGSISGGYNWPNGLGVQGIMNFDGVLVGPSYGVPGLGGAATYSWGINLGDLVDFLEEHF